MFQGQSIVSFFVLAVMAFSVAINRKNAKQADLLLCAYAMLFGALIVEILGDVFGSGSDNSLSAMLLIFQTLLTGMAFLFHFFFVLTVGRHKSGGSFVFLLAGYFAPVLFAIIYWIAEDDVSMVTSSVVVSFLFYFIFTWQMPAKRHMSDDEEYDGNGDDYGLMESRVFNEESEQAGKIREGADQMMLGHPIPFRWEMENIGQFSASDGQDAQNELEIVYDLQEVDFYIPPLLGRRMVELMARLRNEEYKARQPVFVTTERQGENIRLSIENELSDKNQDIKLEEIKWIDRELEAENKRLLIQCGGYLRRIDGKNGIRIVILMPVPQTAPVPPPKMEAPTPYVQIVEVDSWPDQAPDKEKEK